MTQKINSLETQKLTNAMETWKAAACGSISTNSISVAQIWTRSNGDNKGYKQTCEAHKKQNDIN